MVRRCLVVVMAIALLVEVALACPAYTLTYEPLVRSPTKIASDGGIVLVAQRGMREEAPAPRLRAADGTDVSASWVYIAAGLALLKPPVHAGRDLELVRGRGTPLIIRQEGSPARLAPPKVASITSNARRARPSRTPTKRTFGIAATETKLVLADSPPAGAIAVVLYGLGRGEGGRAWARPTASGTYMFSTGGKGCAGGFAPTYIGDRIAVAWVDELGRISPRSKPITVKKAR